MKQNFSAAKKPPFPEKFTSKDAGDSWHLYCRVCKKGWALKKESNHPGNFLNLLNHYGSHK